MRLRRSVGRIVLACLAMGCPVRGLAQCGTCPDPDTSFLLPSMSGQASDFAVRRAGAEANANFKLEVSQDGIYRVTRDDLVAAGYPASSLIGSSIRVFYRTQEVSRVVSTQGQFLSGDDVLFYGLENDRLETPTNAYWISVGEGLGLNMATRSVATNGGGALVASHWYTTRYNPDNLWRPSHEPQASGIDHWFAALLTNENTTVIALDTPDRIASGLATLNLDLFGLTESTINPDHQTRAFINNNPNSVRDIFYDNATRCVTSVTFAADIVAPGISFLYLQQMLTNATQTRERSYLIEASLCFPRELKVIQNELAFCGTTGTNLYRVTGLTSTNALTLLDVTETGNPIRLTDYAVSSNAGAFTVTFRDVTSTPRRYVIANSSTIRTPPRMVPVKFPDLGNVRTEGEYLFIAQRAFRSASYQFARYRMTNGMKTVVAVAEDVYNEFSYGIQDPEAIKQFIGYAYHHWAVPPTYVVLGADGSNDPRNNLGQNRANNLPVKMVPTPFSVAASDAWFATVDGSDLLPDVYIGRIPVNSDAWMTSVLDKTKAFEATPRLNNATLVADNYDASAGDFQQSSEVYIFPYLYALSGVSKAYLDQYQPPIVRSTINATINSGRFLITYVGHGGEDLWAEEDIWNISDILATLNNSYYPIMAVFSCNSAEFDDPSTECLGEEFVQRPGKGGVAMIGPTALSVNLYAERIASGFTWALADLKLPRIGQAWSYGLLGLHAFNPNVSELEVYVLLGDPALWVNRP
ncbi:MAG: hypothetical protein H7A43_10100 [Verrucomicrobia bacterium]|nr:hypothetical protein [Verrucomicrobiota bacterium]